MNAVVKILLRLIGLGRPKPSTLAGRLARRAERAATILGVIYVALQAFPQVIFAHSVTSQGITIYSRSVLPSESGPCIGRAADLLRQSELAVPGRTERVFVCDSPRLFAFFCPTSAGAFAASVPLTDHVFIASADFARDTAHSAAPNYNTRKLSGVIAHEITHGLIRHRLGFWRGIQLPVWLAEGYCDDVAQDGSFPADQGRQLMIDGRDESSPSFAYFRDRQMVRYLIEVEHQPFAGLVERADDRTSVEEKTRAAMRSGILRQ